MNDRVIGLSLEQLRAIPCVIAIASESTKATAIPGALRTGVIDVLATSASNARSVINMQKALQVSHGAGGGSALTAVALAFALPFFGPPLHKIFNDADNPVERFPQHHQQQQRAVYSHTACVAT